MVKFKNKLLSGWAKYPQIAAKVQSPKKLEQINFNSKKGIIARGNGRSYGDSSINNANTADMLNFRKIISFDEVKGIINVESGVMLEDILNFCVKKNWFPPVSPGTKFVTVGGMLACDVHGKNHHNKGSFSNFVKEFKIIDTNKKIKICNRYKNIKLFKDTIGGMGLTGIITEVKFQLIKIQTPFVKQKVSNYFKLKDLMRRFEKNNKEEYSVAWIDIPSFNKKNNSLKSVFFSGNHATSVDLNKTQLKDEDYKVKKSHYLFPMNFLYFFINNFTILFFNKLYFILNKKNLNNVHYDKFFYPLDKIKNWNDIYGKKGFLQYQFVISKKKSLQAMVDTFQLIIEKKCYPTLSVLKLMGKRGEGNLSFAREGYTLALDFPNNKNTLNFLNQLDDIVCKYKGNIYLAKDSRISKEKFNIISENSIKKFRKNNNKKKEITYASSQSIRLGL